MTSEVNGVSVFGCKINWCYCRVHNTLVGQNLYAGSQFVDVTHGRIGYTLRKDVHEIAPQHFVRLDLQITKDIYVRNDFATYSSGTCAYAHTNESKKLFSYQPIRDRSFIFSALVTTPYNILIKCIAYHCITNALNFLALLYSSDRSGKLLWTEG